MLQFPRQFYIPTDDIPTDGGKEFGAAPDDGARLRLPSPEKIDISRVSLRSYNPSDRSYNPSDFDKLSRPTLVACETNWRRELTDFLSGVARDESSCEVATYGDSLVGFIIHRRTVSGLEILTLAVGAEYRRQGIGTLMVRNLTDSLNGFDDILATTISASVNETNLNAQLFFQRVGFEAVAAGTDVNNESDKYLFTYRLAKEELEGQRNQLQEQYPTRDLMPRDLTAVLAIDRQSFQDPWSEEDFDGALGPRNCIGLVIASNVDVVLGYTLYELHENSIRIRRMAVLPDLRRLGLGSKMLRGIQDRLSVDILPSLSMEVAANNRVVNEFLRNAGFKAERGSSLEFHMTYSLLDQERHTFIGKRS